MSEDKIVALRPGVSRETISGFALRFQTETAALSNLYGGDLAGYVILCVNSRGEWNLSFKVDDDADMPMGTAMLAGLAQSAITRNMVAKDAAVETLETYGLVIPPSE